jgi:hypothetical protein
LQTVNFVKVIPLLAEAVFREETAIEGGTAIYSPLWFSKGIFIFKGGFFDGK